MTAAKKTAAKAEPADAIIEPQTAEQKRWANSSFTDDELVVILAVMTKTPPKSGAKAPKDILDRVMTVAKRQGVTVSDAKEIIRKAMTPTGQGAKAAAKPQPARAPVKDSPKQRPHPGQPPKHPAPQKKATAKVASTGQSKPEIIVNAISAKTGASLTTLMNLTGWQAHSVRGAIATLKTQHGYGIDSEKRGTDRIYTLTSRPEAAAEPKAKAAAATRKPAPRAVKKAAKKTPARKKAR